MSSAGGSRNESLISPASSGYAAFRLQIARDGHGSSGNGKTDRGESGAVSDTSLQPAHFRLLLGGWTRCPDAGTDDGYAPSGRSAEDSAHDPTHDCRHRPNAVRNSRCGLGPGAVRYRSELGVHRDTG